MVGITCSQPGHVVGDVGGGHVADLGPAGRGQRRGVPVQIPLVRLECVGGQPALDGKVVEVAADRRADGRQLRANQLSTSDSGTTGSPWASATGPQVIAPW